MICYAKKSEFNQIIDLFNRCFKGEEQFAELFFDNFYKCEDTIVYKINDKIVGMVQMMPYEVNSGKATYIYGACTDENFRKQGIMEQLLERSFEISKTRGHKFSILIPGEEWLFDFYKKYGYEANLYIFEGIHTAKDLKNTILTQTASEQDIEDIKKVYENSLKEDFYIKRTNRNFQDQFKLFECAKFVENSQIVGYAFYYKSEEQYKIEEVISFDLDKSLDSICDYLKIEEILYKTVGNNKKIGCIKDFSLEKETFGYINLMFN